MPKHKARPKREYPTPPVPPQPKKPSQKWQRPCVSDHAVLRYLQRVLSIDVDRIRGQILSDGRAELIRRIQSGKVRTTEFTLVVRDQVVVSVIVPGQEDY